MVVVKTNVDQIHGIDWLDDATLVFDYAHGVTADFRLGTVKTAGGDMQPLAVQTSRTCVQDRFANPHTMATGHLALTYDCVETATSGVDPVTILSIVPPSSTSDQLGTVGRTDNYPSQIATSPDGKRVLVGLGLLCGIIVEATESGAKPLMVEVSDGRSTTHLDDMGADSDCSDEGWALYPAWSPDGAKISFFAAPAAIGVSGPARADVAATLYSMDPDATSATAVLRAVEHPRGLDYSPDGKRLAFGAKIDGRSAIWVLDVESGDLTSVYDGKVGWLAWSPDGLRIAATRVSTDAPPFPTQIILVDVTAKTKPS